MFETLLRTFRDQFIILLTALPKSKNIFLKKQTAYLWASTWSTEVAFLPLCWFSVNESIMAFNLKVFNCCCYYYYDDL